MNTLQDLAHQLASHGQRNSLGLRHDLGLTKWTYEQLYLRSRQAAGILQRAGVSKGDYVFIRAPNCPEWVAFFFGAMLRGAILVPLDYNAPPEFVRRIGEQTQPKLCLNAGEPCNVEGAPSLDLRCLYNEPAPSPLSELQVPVSSSHPAVIFFTSGSTGTPRGVILTHNNIMSVIARFRHWRWLAWCVPARIAVLAPLSHAQGIMMGLAIPLSMGLCVIYSHSTHPGRILRMLRDNRIVLLCTVPRVLHVLAEYFRQQRYGKGPQTLGQKLEPAKAYALRRHYIFTHMRRIIGYRFWVVFVGGAPLPNADERFWRESGCLLMQGYGLTETSAIVSVNTPWSGAFGSVGRSFADQEIRIAEDGEVLVRGPNVMTGYAAERDQSAFAEGFLRTGDIGRFDSRKRLYVLGRKKEVIVTGEGFNVYPSDVEGVLNSIPKVRDSVVLGLEYEGHMQVHAVLLLAPETSPAEVIIETNQRLLEYQRIQSWTVWPDNDFPRTVLLKPRLNLIEDRLRKLRDLHVPSAAPLQPMSLSDILKVEDKQLRLLLIARFVAEKKLSNPEDGNVNLVRELGVTSLDMVELMTLLEKESGYVLDVIVANEEVTVGQLQHAMREAAREQNLRGRDSKDPPKWASLRMLGPVRRLLNPLVLRTWTNLCARLTVNGQPRLAGLSCPVILAVGGHAHGFDTLLVYSSLPPHLRGHLAVVISRWLFGAFLDPGPDTRRVDRFLATLGFKVLVPLFFPMALTSHFERTREDLMDACRLLDEGYSLIVFEGRGVAKVAKQCGVPLVPVRLNGNSKIRFTPRLPRASVSVTFGQPIHSELLTEQEVLESLDSFFSSFPEVL